MIVFYNASCLDYSAPNHPERPARVARSVPFLRKRHPDWEWRIPKPVSEAAVLRAHSRDHLEKIRNATRDFDADTPVHPKIYEHALHSAGAAIEDGGDASQPPTTKARVERVAIWDFDAHHGNGTEAIVAQNSQVAFASIHQFPGYPGTGTESFANVMNYPLGPGTPRNHHVEVAKRALDKLVAFKPELLLVSAGFDAYARDPLVQMTLQPEDFATFGEWMSQLDVPVATILEGGYSEDLPELIDAFLTAWQS